MKPETDKTDVRRDMYAREGLTGKLQIALLCAVCACSACADVITLDLTGGDSSAPKRTLAAVPEEGLRRRTNLAPGVACVRPLDCGDQLRMRLFPDIEVNLRLTEQLASILGGASFLATAEGYEGLCNAVVHQVADGLLVDVRDFRKGRVLSVVSSSDGTVVREFNPQAGRVKPCAIRVPDLTRKASAAAPSALGLGVATETLADQSETTIDILIAYDQGAALYAAEVGGVTNFAQMAVSRMNAVIANNGLAADLRFRLVGVTTLGVSTTDVCEALDALNDDRKGWKAAKTRRDELGADIVCTLIDTGSAYGITGVGWSLMRGSVSDFKEWAYNVCSIRAVQDSCTLMHEVGHNLGAGHATEVAESDDPGPQRDAYSAGHYFCADEAWYHTVMAYNSDGLTERYYSEAPLFSSPDRTWQGVAAGDAQHDNERTLRGTFKAASAWRPTRVADLRPDPLADCTVVFEANGGSGEMPNLSCPKGVVCKLPRNGFRHGTRQFVGWAGENGRRYDDEMLVFDLGKPGETVTLKAIWAD